ncbi:hypothetical protein ECG_07275 [Echinococcus granulosus]|uniref:Uncharacterized protein n=1 Tax=Echinococcus granulosus TaxID=6210 RepID=W6UE35_ECHGR|nr:hypothetical protein EGR_05437 [Echinococcus granulosus]EUB59675.1 hypothetical protein EGR_05437 [Echinococcus granulosus]KAH9280832.1 hypothetical protein ECG_07275 [Echinococcus granulosus]
MDRKILHLIFSLAVGFLFFFAIGYDGWGPGGQHSDTMTGALLLTTGFVVLIAGIVLIRLILSDYAWIAIVACAYVFISAFLSIVGLCFYAKSSHIWSPIIGTAATTLTVVLSIILIFDLAYKHFTFTKFFV